MLRSQVPSYFKSRRDALMRANPGAAFVLPSTHMALRNPDVEHPFRQESNFYYLTGFEEAESFLVLAAGKMTLFVLKRDPEKEMWEGERYGVEGARQIFGADEAFVASEFDSKVPELLKGCDKVYYRLGQSEANDRRIMAAVESARRSQGRSGKALMPVADPNDVIGEMRLFKSTDEIAMIRKACEISAQAHKTVMRETRPGMNEFEIEALIDYLFRKNGCQRLGYGSIVAGGKNAACLHYRFNNETLRDGDLLLIDAGGEHGYYTADITRTFPVGRQFTKAQAKAYDLVLSAQKAAIAMAKPGATMKGLHERACEVITEGLLSMGLLKGKKEDLIKNAGFKRFYPHGTGHWLGMDVHDVGLYVAGENPRPLEPGMVFTIEPGFYVQPSDTDGMADYAGIGIRIEDDILVTTSGCEVLTHSAPKERADIESLRS